MNTPFPFGLLDPDQHRALAARKADEVFLNLVRRDGISADDLKAATAHYVECHVGAMAWLASRQDEVFRTAAHDIVLTAFLTRMFTLLRNERLDSFASGDH